MSFTVRPATPADVPVLSALIDASVRKLQAGDYTPAQIDIALRAVYGADTQLIADGTYFVVETEPGPGSESPKEIVACGGWSKRRTLYGGDHYAHREDGLLDPATEAARIRAFFVHPAWARRGIGTLLLAACESAGLAAGFTRFEMGSTLTGVALYSARGYTPVEEISVPLPGGETLAVIRMEKRMMLNNQGRIV